MKGLPVTFLCAITGLMTGLYSGWLKRLFGQGFNPARINREKNLIGKRCECIFTGLMATGVIEDTEENEHTIVVKVRFDQPHQWGDDLYNDVWAWGRKTDEFGTLHHLRLLADEPDFQTMTVVFGEPISQIDRSVFEDVDTWGVCSLQGWVNSYESVRFVAINNHTAVITDEYNMEQAKMWLEKYTSIKSLKTS